MTSGRSNWWQWEQCFELFVRSISMSRRWWACTTRIWKTRVFFARPIISARRGDAKLSVWINTPRLMHLIFTQISSSSGGGVVHIFENLVYHWGVKGLNSRNKSFPSVAFRLSSRRKWELWYLCAPFNRQKNKAPLNKVVSILLYWHTRLRDAVCAEQFRHKLKLVDLLFCLYE